MSAAWLEPLPGITLDELNAAAALQSRTDRKYVLDAHTAQRVLRGLPRDAHVLDVGGQRAFGYHSVYFDTPELTSYHLSAHARRRRFKVRTRSYIESAATFLEVKTRGSRAITVKDRVPHPAELSDELNDDGRRYLEDQLAGTLKNCSAQVRQLRPVLTSTYRRSTILLPTTRSRVTLDTGLTWTDATDAGSHESFTLSDQVILETKSAGSAGPLDRLLWRCGIRPARISKFATGLAVLHPELPSNRWHRTLKQHRVTRVSAPAAGGRR